ncbi:MAG: UTP--glucose-1-phosphate uridylyltransferase GalU [Gammaproteobacteria bacterium]|nr:UTP--glucose-1-phosphate uridylyltransferase GalU [Gammaproteobacteria bacterium]
MPDNKITTAVFPVAGRGTRFLPATKASPKEMLPIVDKPLIQYAVEEAIAAGAENLVFITGRAKRAIEDHFDSNHELERELDEAGKNDLLKAVQGIVPASATCIYIRQSAPLGLGHAVLCARRVVGDSPFYVHLADDLIDARVPCLKQMREVHERTGASVIGVQRVPADETEKYGVVAVDGFEQRVGRINRIVEKPKPADAPSNLGVVGRYLLSPAIFDMLESTGRGAGGEIQLTDAIAALLSKEQVNAYEFDGVRYDCGSKLGYLKATVDYALNHHSLGGNFADFLIDVADELSKTRKAGNQ